MSFGEAVSYVQSVGAIINLLLLSVPIGAVLAIRRGKRNRPETRLVFPRLVLWGWVTLLVLAVAYFFTGAWYGENGPPPQTVAAQVTVTLLGVLLGVVAVHVGLYVTTQPKREQ
jgi:polyferredoxin